jgi:hypothetical protein
MRRSLPKSIHIILNDELFVKRHGVASITPNRRLLLAAPATVPHCRIEFPWIPHEFRIHGIQLVLILTVTSSFVMKKGAIIEVLIMYLTDHFIYFTENFTHFTDRLNRSRFYL